MGFQVGNQVIHCTFGLGEITQIEEMTINGKQENCYVVRMNDMTIWIPMNDEGQNSLREPTPPEEFINTLPILTSPEREFAGGPCSAKKAAHRPIKRWAIIFNLPGGAGFEILPAQFQVE